MTVKFLRNLLILFAFAIVGHASAQYVPIHSIDSVDLSALEAHSIVIGKITAVTNKLNENRQEYRETDVDVLETLKGEHRSKLRINLMTPIAQLETWKSNSTRLLFYDHSIDNLSRNNVVELESKELAVSTADFNILRQSKDLLSYIRRVLLENKDFASERSMRIWPKDDEIGRAWNKQFKTNIQTELIVPLTKRVEADAINDLSSTDTQTRLSAVIRLSRFESKDNIERLKKLLNDESSTVTMPAEYSNGIEHRQYQIRRFAYNTLQSWRVNIPTPVFEFTVPKLETITKVFLNYTGFSTEDLVSFQSAKNLRTLELDSSRLDHDQLMLIGRLTQLTNLKMVNLQIDDVGFSRLAGLTNLETLEIDDIPITDASLKVIAGWPNLKEVTLKRTDMTDAGLKWLREARPNLKVKPALANTRIFSYIDRRDIEGVKRTLDRSPDAVYQRLVDFYGDTTLHRAVWNNEPEIAQLLLTRGADVDAENDQGETTLGRTGYLSARVGLVRLLLGHGANPNHARHDGKTIAQLELGGWRDQFFDNYRLLLACGVEPSPMLAPYANRTPEDRLGNKRTIEMLERAVELSKHSVQLVKDSKAKCDRVAYQLNLESFANWSTSPLGRLTGPLQASKSPSGKSFFGPFGQQSVSLGLSHLPPHKNVHVEIELYIIGSWDGNGGLGSGPDILDIQVPGVGTLLHSTFFNNNAGDDALLPMQSFPDPYPFGNHVGGTGAEKFWEEGFYASIGSRDNPRNGVYKLHYTFNHSDSSFHLNFNGLTVPESEITRLIDDETWGIGSLVVSTD